ncbi:GMC oxidoreductase [Sphingobacterium chuzhouense]|uniref:GMC family oxidoreductase n=1 Tax=Sphingobacterium chuzhouense TaxID=1742264 RepID=A0ABR7XT31_9SPHI|nr:GMC family oxidoreductase [Sphingobacterium chuzhouense]MBD1421669.1 GMC family oxidoreductase [Sphingobacterium chuzhouense]
MPKANHFDAIVIGSGISGGWTAKECCEQGLKTLVLERGENVAHIKDYPTANLDTWQFPHRNRVPLDILKENPIASRCYAFREDAMHFFTKDSEQPYIQEKPFDWIRGYQVGGKSLIWARQVQRWSDFDFEGPARDGFATDWPIRYHDLAPWYSYVEKFIGVSGKKEGNPAMPDGEFLPPFELNAVEQAIQDKINSFYSDRQVISGRCAHITEPKPIHLAQGRTSCQARSLCSRGCPFGGYFSSNASTLPWAAKTGNLTLKSNSIVESIVYNDEKGKATGVRVVDRRTKEVIEYFAPVIFVNASALATNLILLNSRSKRFPNGLGNDNDILGKYIAFHNYMGTLSGEMEGFEDKYHYGRRPTQPIIPNFRNVVRQETSFLRGYASFFSAYRSQGYPPADTLGASFKDSLLIPGGWNVSMMMQGETIPIAENHVRLSDTQIDSYGVPQLVTSIGYQENDYKILEDFLDQGAEMMEVSGVKNITKMRTNKNPGLDIHEMGGARMGNNPATSLVNKWNQLHACSNVFVTDGACMTSTGTQNPSLTYMALAARAVHHAIQERKKKNL